MGNGECTTITPALDIVTAGLATTTAGLNAAVTALLSNSMVSKPGLAIGSTPANVANLAVTFKLAGVQYSKVAVAAGTAPGNDVVPVDTYGAVALDIDAAGTITVIEAADNVTGYASAALALADIAEPLTAKARLGTVSVIRATAGAFTFGTTSLADGDTTVVYTDATTTIEDLATV